MDNLAPLSSKVKKLKKRASKKQIEANRRNGKLGGPKTVAGKMRVSQNATKHALLAKEVVIEVGDGKENKHEFDQLFEELVCHFAPQGPIERILVEKIAVSIWRYKRFIRAETGEIRKNTDSLESQIKENAIREQGILKLFPLCGQGKLETITNVLILQDLLNLLEESSNELKDLYYFTDLTLKQLVFYFGREPGSIAALCLLHNWEFKEDAESLIEKDKDPSVIPEIESIVELVLKRFEQEKERVQSQLEIIQKRNELILSSQILSLNVPPIKIMDTFLRYESAITRQLYKALNELERLQRLRQGDFVPPPLNVEVQ